MIAGVSRKSRRKGRDVHLARSAASHVFDQYCPNLLRYGRCRRYEAQQERAAEVRAKRQALHEQNKEVASALLGAGEEDVGEDVDMVNALIGYDPEGDAPAQAEEAVPSVALMFECPFRHQRSNAAATERDAIVERLIEYFVLERHSLYLHHHDVKDLVEEEFLTHQQQQRQGSTDAGGAASSKAKDEDEELRLERELKLHAAKNPVVQRTIVTRRGSTIVLSRFAACFGAYLCLDDAPEQLQVLESAEEGDNATTKLEPVTGSNGLVAKASAAMAANRRRVRGRYRRYDQPEYTTCAELSLRSTKVCDLVGRALATMVQRGYAVDGVIATDNDVTDLHPLLGALKKHRLAASLCFLDASRNELETLRFLFTLRADFPMLLSMRLFDNPITRKPEYREQLRKTLPTLVRLDDEPVRRPPLSLPYPVPSPIEFSSCEFHLAARFVAALLDSFERDLVDEDFAARHFHPSISFTMTVHPDCAFGLPSTAVTAEERAALETATATARQQRKLEKAAKAHSTTKNKKKQLRTDEDAQSGADGMNAEEEDDGEGGSDDGVVTVKTRKVKETYLVTPQDAREAQLFDVSLRNASRDLRVGKEALHKYARGPLAALTAYTSTLYPHRFPTDHHLDFAQWDAIQLPIPLLSLSTAGGAANGGGTGGGRLSDMPAPVKKTKAPKLPTASPRQEVRDVFVDTSMAEGFLLVTVHGVISWRIPSIHGESAYRCFFDRTLTLVPKPGVEAVAPPENNNNGDWADEDALIEALERYLVYGDQCTLRPIPRLGASRHDIHKASRTATKDAAFAPSTTASTPVFDRRHSKTYVRRLAMEYQTSEATVRSALERSTSDACVHGVLAELTKQGMDPSAEALNAPTMANAEGVVNAEEHTAATAGNKRPTRPAEAPDEMLGTSGSTDTLLLPPLLRRHQSEAFRQSEAEVDATQQQQKKNGASNHEGPEN